jgi:hypothetical protein
VSGIGRCARPRGGMMLKTMRKLTAALQYLMRESAAPGRPHHFVVCAAMFLLTTSIVI